MSSIPGMISGLSSLMETGTAPEQQPAQQLSPAEQQALLELRNRFSDITYRARREYVRKCLYLHNLFRGAHYLAWNGDSFVEVPPGPDGQQPGRSLFVLNFFQGFVLSIVALMSTNRPTIKFYPDNSDDEADIAEAKASNTTIRAFERENNPTQKLIDLIYLLCTDGTVGTYIRTVSDGERFGWDELPVFGTQQVPAGLPGFTCYGCGETTYVEQPGSCPRCGEALPPSPSVMPEMIDQPIQTGTKRVPRGRTVRTDVGGLELHLPPAADDQHDFPFLGRQREVDKGKVRATYPEIADSIVSGSTMPTTAALSTVERRARAEASHGTTMEGAAVFIDNGDRVTLTEYWFRPTAFWHLDNKKMRDGLLTRFPDGVKVTWANDTFCEANPESMDDHWRICHALPGRGQIREPIFASLAPVQEMANDLFNIIRDIIEFTLPITFIDSQVVKVSALRKSKATPGGMYNVTGRAGRAVGDGFYQTQPGQLPQYVTVFLNDLRTNIAQFLTGAFPAAYGGGTGSNSTAEGIAREQSASLGRIAMFLTQVKNHYAEFGPLVVEDFHRNGSDPLSVVDRNEGGDLTTTSVKPDDLGKGKARTIAEMDESYPTTWPQMQALYMQGMQNPQMMGIFAKLKNQDKVKTTLGMDLSFPGEDAYAFQWAQIKQLLATPPKMVPGQPMVDPTTGMVNMPPPTEASTVDINPLDDNASMLEACSDFYFSDAGKRAAVETPDGFRNFMLLASARKAALQPPMPPQGAPAPGGVPAPQQPPPGAQPPAGAP